jgi:hypothetical protein
MLTRYFMTLSVTVFALVFLALSGWGLFDVARLGWCNGGLVSCAQAQDAVGHAFGCALVGAAIAFLAAILTKGRDLRSARHSLLVGLASAALLVVGYPITQSIRSALATQYFPYNTAFRFGPLGFYSVWIIVSILALVIALAGARMLREGREQA